MMLSMNVEAEGAREAAQAFGDLSPEIRKAITSGMAKGLMWVADEAKLIAPVDEGIYRASIGNTAKGGIFSVSERQFLIDGRVGTKVQYGPYIEFGTRAHRIQARRKKVLSFYWGRLGKKVAFKSVWHPGTKARWILTKAFRKRSAQLFGEINKRIEWAIEDAVED